MSKWLRQSTASQEVIIGTFVDDGDFKTPETSLSIANTDIKIWKEGATSEANKNSGGATHITAGRYYLVLDATDTNTLGQLEINIAVSGALPCKREFMVVPADIYDAMILGALAQPGQEAPAATNNLARMVAYLFKAWRNRKVQSSSQYSLYNDNATTVDQKATVSADGTSADVGEVASGP